MAQKNKASAHEKSLTVSEYSRQFFERTVSKAYAADPEENQTLANQNFVNLIRKLQEAGSKDDIKVPLRVLRDEIGRIYFGSAKQRNEKIECLFKLYDALEAGAQEDLKTKEGKQASAAVQVLDELRQRFLRLVIGDTWEAWPELKLMALKRMHSYAVKENFALKEAAIASPPPTPSSGRLGMRKLSRTFSGVSGGAATGGAQWQATIDDLGKAAGTRLLPLIKLLLLENSDLPEDARQGLAAEANSNGIINKAASDGLRSQTSGFSEPEVTRRVADLNLDDLLGLNDIVEEEEPSPKQADPFKAPEDNSIKTHGSADFNPQRLPSIPHPVPQQQPPYHGQPNGENGYALSPRSSSGLPPSPSQYHQPGHTNGGYHQQQAVHPAYDRNAFGSQTGFHPGSALQVPGSSYPRGAPSNDAAVQPGGFNPFGLPSPTYATPVPPNSDNNFAAFSPVAAAPPPPIPQPMRAPPQPPSHTPAYQPQQNAYSAW